MLVEGQENPFKDKRGYYRLPLSVVTLHFRLVMYYKLFSKFTLYIKPGKYFIEKGVYRLLYTFIKSVCQKRKSKIDGSLLNVMHI